MPGRDLWGSKGRSWIKSPSRTYSKERRKRSPGNASISPRRWRTRAKSVTEKFMVTNKKHSRALHPETHGGASFQLQQMKTGTGDIIRQYGGP